MTTGRTVEVEGIFWKEREANGHRLLNNVEAQHVTFYPPLTPDQAARPSPYLTSFKQHPHHVSDRKLSGANCACSSPKTS